MTVAEPAKCSDEREKRLSSRLVFYIGKAKQQNFNVLYSRSIDPPACRDISPIQLLAWQDKRQSR